ncbi:MAG TPA: Hsp20/alpha crystallin family protein [Gemmatimonadaceae bacterium]|nr:Hsp20/alpha crystallin family protein [Gemmatimonadaceae bacterium]
MLYGTTLATPFGLRREIDKLFDEAMSSGGRGMSWAPVVDIQEDEKEIAIVAELPGLKPDQVDVTCENGVLNIRGEKSAERKESDQNRRYHLIERSYGAFSRSFQLPQGLDESKIEASFDGGVLTVHVPKAALPQPKKIQINVGSGPQHGRVESGNSSGKN